MLCFPPCFSFPSNNVLTGVTSNYFLRSEKYRASHLMNVSPISNPKSFRSETRPNYIGADIRLSRNMELARSTIVISENTVAWMRARRWWHVTLGCILHHEKTSMLTAYLLKSAQAKRFSDCICSGRFIGSC